MNAEETANMFVNLKSHRGSNAEVSLRVQLLLDMVAREAWKQGLKAGRTAEREGFDDPPFEWAKSK